MVQPDAAHADAADREDAIRLLAHVARDQGEQRVKVERALDIGGIFDSCMGHAPSPPLQAAMR